MNWQGKNVLMILDRWCPTYQNKNMGKVLKFLSINGARVHIYCHPHPDNIYIKQFLPEAILHDFRNTKNFFARLFSFLKLLRKIKIDIVLWTYASYDFKENILLPFVRLFLGIPYIIKSDSYIPEYKPGKNLIQSIRQKISLSLFILFPGRYANLLLAETKIVAESIGKIYRNKNVYYFPNGVLVKKLNQMKEIYLRTAAPVRRPYILFTGRISRSKGIDLLIKSFRLISAQLPEWSVQIVGHIWEDDYAKECLALVKDYDLEDKIFFQPGAFGEELFIWYHFAEFFVLPSREEGLPNRIFEAMFFGNPVVSFNVGQVKSIINSETGIVIETENITEFARAMLLLATNKDKCREMGKKARELIEKNFDDEKIILEMLKICAGFVK